MDVEKQILLDLNKNVLELSKNITQNTSAISAFKEEIGSLKSQIGELEGKVDKNTTWINITKGVVTVLMGLSGIVASINIIKEFTS